MTKFIDVKEEFEFNGGASPIVAFTLNPSRIEKYNEKKLDKVWKLFKKQYIDVDSEEYYAINEGITIYEDIPEDDDILNGRYIAYISRFSFDIISNLLNRNLKELIFGVRLIDESGTVRAIKEGYFDEDFEDGDPDKAIEGYEYIQEKLKLMVDNQEIEESRNVKFEKPVYENEEKLKNEVEETAKKDEEVSEEPSKEIITEDTNHEELNFQKIENVQEEEIQEQEQEVSLVEYVLQEKTQELNKAIEDCIEDKQIILDDNIMNINFSEEDYSEMNPVLKTISTNIEYRTIQTNKELKNKREQAIITLRDFLLEKLTEGIYGTARITSFEENNSKFRKKYLELNGKLEEEIDKIENSVIEIRVLEEKKYNRRREEYIGKIVDKLRRDYDDEHLHEVEENVENYELSKKGQLNDNYNEELASLVKQSEDKFIEKTNPIIQDLFNINKKTIKNIINQYTDETVEIHTVTDELNAKDFKSMEDKLFKITEDSKRIKEKIEKEIEEKTRDYAEVLNEKEKNELALTKMIEENGKLQEKNEQITQYGDRYKDDLIALIALNKNQYLDADKQKNVNQLNKNVLVISMTALACVVIISIASMNVFSKNNKKEENSNFNTAKIETTVTEKTEEQEEQTTAYKKGDTVSINVNNEIVSAIVESIEKNIITVKTKDGTEYIITQ